MGFFNVVVEGEVCVGRFGERSVRKRLDFVREKGELDCHGSK